MPKKIILHYTKRRRYKDYTTLCKAVHHVSLGAELAIESLQRLAESFKQTANHYQQLKDKAE